MGRGTIDGRAAVAIAFSILLVTGTMAPPVLAGSSSTPPDTIDGFDRSVDDATDDGDVPAADHIDGELDENASALEFRVEALGALDDHARPGHAAGNRSLGPILETTTRYVVDENRVNSSRVFETDRYVVSQTQQHATDAATTLAASDLTLAATALEDALRVRAILSETDVEFDEEAVDESIELAFEHLEKSQQKLSDGRLVASVVHAEKAWTNAQRALEHMDAAVEPDVTITTRADPPHDGNVTYTLRGTIFDVHTGALEATVSVDGDERELSLQPSTVPGETATFDEQLVLENSTTVVTVTAIDPREEYVEIDATGRPDHARGNSPSGKEQKTPRKGPKHGSSGNQPDSEADGTESQIGSDVLELDADALPDRYEREVTGTDPLDPDSDSRVTEPNESEMGILDGQKDFSGDGLTAYREYLIGTDPTTDDTSGDGLTDGWQVFVAGTDPLVNDTSGDGTPDAETDLSGDGLTLLEEQEHGTNPHVDDTDRDGLTDYDEIHVYGTDPLNPDTSRDGLTDGEKVRLGLDPSSTDSSGDGTPDNESTYTTTTVEEETGVSVAGTGEGAVAEGIHVQNVTPDASASNPLANATVSPTVRITNTTDFEYAVVTIPIDESVSTEELENVSIYRWDPHGNATWAPLETTLDAENRTVSATVTQFSFFEARSTARYSHRSRDSASLGWPQIEGFDSLTRWTTEGDVSVSDGTVTIRSEPVPDEPDPGDGSGGDDGDDSGDGDSGGDSGDGSGDDSNDSGDGGDSGDENDGTDGDDDDDAELEPPTAKIDVGTHSPARGEQVEFDGSDSYSPNGKITRYKWSGAVSGTGSSASTSFSSPGAHTVTLTVTDEAGKTDSATAAVYVPYSSTAATTSVETLFSIEPPTELERAHVSDGRTLETAEEDGDEPAVATNEFPTSHSLATAGRSSISRALEVPEGPGAVNFAAAVHSSVENDGRVRVRVEGETSEKTIYVRSGRSPDSLPEPTPRADISEFAGEEVTVRFETVDDAELRVDYVTVFKDTSEDGIPDAVQGLDLRMPSGPPDIRGQPLELDPTVKDTSGDGLLDRDQVDIDWWIEGTRLYAEVTSASARPGQYDTDGDGLSDHDELEVWETNPFFADTSGDGYIDSVDPDPLVKTTPPEARFGSLVNPIDGMSDIESDLSEYLYIEARDEAGIESVTVNGYYDTESIDGQSYWNESTGEHLLVTADGWDLYEVEIHQHSFGSNPWGEPPEYYYLNVTDVQGHVISYTLERDEDGSVTVTNAALLFAASTRNVYLPDISDPVDFIDPKQLKHVLKRANQAGIAISGGMVVKESASSIYEADQISFVFASSASAEELPEQTFQLPSVPPTPTEGTWETPDGLEITLPSGATFPHEIRDHERRYGWEDVKRLPGIEGVEDVGTIIRAPDAVDEVGDYTRIIGDNPNAPGQIALWIVDGFILSADYVIKNPRGIDELDDVSDIVKIGDQSHYKDREGHIANKQEIERIVENADKVYRNDYGLYIWVLYEAGKVKIVQGFDRGMEDGTSETAITVSTAYIAEEGEAFLERFIESNSLYPIYP